MAWFVADLLEPTALVGVAGVVAWLVTGGELL